MDIGLREWLVIGGVILIGLIILDGWRRMNGNRNRLRMDIDPNVADLPEEPVRTHNPELPNGGARLVGEDPLFAELEQERESHNGQDHAESDPLFDSPDVEPDGRIEPAFGDEINRRDIEEQTLDPHDLNEEPERHSAGADNAEFDELLGPARVVSATHELPSPAEACEPEPAEAPVPESLEAVSAYTDGTPADLESAAESMRFEADTQPEQDPEPLFPTLDGYDEPEITREAEASVTAPESDLPDFSIDEGIISEPRIVEIRPESEEEQEQVADVQPETESFAEPEEPARKPESLFNRSVDNNPESEFTPVQLSDCELPAEPVKPQMAAVSNEPEPELDLDKPITLLLDDNETETEAAEAPSLFADDPIAPEVEDPPLVAAVKPKTATKPAPRKKAVVAEQPAELVPETKDLFAERPTLGKTPSPDSVLAITVLAAEDLPIPGAKLLPLVSACGMRFGDMEIFHRFEDGLEEGAVQFSMANAIKPGTFDIDNMDAVETRGLTFFMSMEEPRDVMNAFECMLATAETVAKHMGAELLDENRSVLRPQTKEHYRQRIRDFGMRNLARRAH